MSAPDDAVIEAMLDAISASANERGDSRMSRTDMRAALAAVDWRGRVR